MIISTPSGFDLITKSGQFVGRFPTQDEAIAASKTTHDRYKTPHHRPSLCPLCDTDGVKA